MDDRLICREIIAMDNKALRLAAARESASGSSIDYGLEMKSKFLFSSKHFFNKSYIIFKKAKIFFFHKMTKAKIALGLFNIIASFTYLKAVIYDCSAEGDLQIERAGYNYHKTFGGRFKFLTFINTVIPFFKIGVT